MRPTIAVLSGVVMLGALASPALAQLSQITPPTEPSLVDQAPPAATIERSKPKPFFGSFVTLPTLPTIPTPAIPLPVISTGPPTVSASEPLVAVVVGVGLLGAQFLRRHGHASWRGRR